VSRDCDLFLVARGFEIRVRLVLRRVRFRRRISVGIERMNRFAEAHPLTVEHFGLQLVEREIGIVIRDMCGGERTTQQARHISRGVPLQIPHS